MVSVDHWELSRKPPTDTKEPSSDYQENSDAMNLMSPQGSDVYRVSDSTDRHCQSRSKDVLPVSDTSSSDERLTLTDPATNPAIQKQA